MKKYTIPFILTGIIAVMSVVLIRQSTGKIGGSTGIRNYADNIVNFCEKEKSVQTCYDREIPKLMKHITMEDAFLVTKIIQENDSSYAYCHVLGHELSSRETKKDPAKWKDVITRCPSGMCSNGCIHGAFQERFRLETVPENQIPDLLPELSSVCDARGSWNPTGLERASCYHALGHLFMYITHATIGVAVNLCDMVSNKGNDGDYRNVCYDGAFMQLFQPLEPEDKALIKGKEPTRDTHKKLCSPFSGEKLTSCVTEGWPMYFDSLQEPAGALKLCSMIPRDYQDRCITSLMYIITVQYHFNLDVLRGYCQNFPDEYRGKCFAMVASRLIETDYGNIKKAVDWCLENTGNDPKSICFTKLIEDAGFTFHTWSAQFMELCTAMPDPWKSICLKKQTVKN